MKLRATRMADGGWKMAVVALLLLLGLLLPVVRAQFVPGTAPVFGSGGSGSSSSGGGVDTNAVIALIEQYGGGAVKSNAVLSSISLSGLFTNGPDYLFVTVPVQVRITNSLAATSAVGITLNYVDVSGGTATNIDTFLTYGNTAGSTNSGFIKGFIPPGKRWSTTAITTGSGAVSYDVSLGGINNGVQLTYFGTNSGSGGGGVSGLATNAINATNVYHGGSIEIVKIISQTPPAITDSNWFGPWTPGTTTAGIQEAWDSVVKPTNAGPIAKGVTFRFQGADSANGGYYFITNTLTFSNYWPMAMVFEGAGLLQTKLVYAGTLGQTNFIQFKGAGTPRAGSLNIPLHLDVRNLGFSAINDTNNILVYITNYSYAKFENCNFEGWQSMTNQVEGAGVSLSDTSEWATNGNLVGLKFEGPNEHSTILDNIFFAALATGVHAKNDHVTATSLKFARVGRRVHKWPATSVYSLGACVINETALDSDWFYLHCYNSKLAFLVNGAMLGRPNLWHINFEDVDNYTATTDSTRGINLIQPNWYDILEVTTWDLLKTTYCLVASNSPNFGLTTVPNLHSTMWGYDPYSSSLTEIIGTNVVKKSTASGTAFVGTVALGVATTANGPITITDPATGNLLALDASAGIGMNISDSGFSTYVIATPEGTVDASASVTTPKLIVGTPTITSGSGAPSASEPNGSIYLRTDGTSSTTIYLRAAGAWTAVTP